MIFFPTVDLENPDWAGAGRVHDWRNYCSYEIRAMWETFTDKQKAALVAQAQAQADREDWE